MDNQSNTSAIVMGLIIVLVLLIGGYYLLAASNAPSNSNAPAGADINVTLPTGSGEQGGPVY